jgi:hypothetical protein
MLARKKPVVIEVIQWTGLNMQEITSFCSTCFRGSKDALGNSHVRRRSYSEQGRLYNQGRQARDI